MVEISCSNAPFVLEGAVAAGAVDQFSEIHDRAMGEGSEPTAVAQPPGVGAADLAAPFVDHFAQAPDEAGVRMPPQDLELPAEPVDVIYLCFPNNPTGAVASYQTMLAPCSNEWIAR